MSEQFERFKPLLKDYQEELDSMAKRARYAEGVFVQMCQRVYRAMDMVSNRIMRFCEVSILHCLGCGVGLMTACC